VGDVDHGAPVHVAFSGDAVEAGEALASVISSRFIGKREQDEPFWRLQVLRQIGRLFKQGDPRDQQPR